MVCSGSAAALRICSNTSYYYRVLVVVSGTVQYVVAAQERRAENYPSAEASMEIDRSCGAGGRGYFLSLCFYCVPISNQFACIVSRSRELVGIQPKRLPTFRR